MINSPIPPQCFVMSPFRWAGFPLMKTVVLPVNAFHVFPSQQGTGFRGHPIRNAGKPFT